MAVFRNVPEEWQRLDWIIFQSGWVSLYMAKKYLMADISWFRSQRYRVIDFDCSSWTDEQAALADLKAKFRFREHFTNTLTSLRDSLIEIDIIGTGMVVVLHQFHQVERQLGQSLLDILADTARLHMLRGERLLVLAQVEQREQEYLSAGKSTVTWNPHELVQPPQQ